MTPNLKISGVAPTEPRASTAVAYELIGFLAIIALSWINELLGLPGLIFASDHRGGWQESVLETAIILLVAVPVIMLTRRLAARLHYLEEFLRLCAWCGKIHSDGEWVPVEDFLQRRFDTQACHGICPACRAEQRKSAGLKRARQRIGGAPRSLTRRPRDAKVGAPRPR